jgi:predicted DNA-binding protein
MKTGNKENGIIAPESKVLSFRMTLDMHQKLLDAWSKEKKNQDSHYTVADLIRSAIDAKIQKM